MILPTKYIPPGKSLFAVSVGLLARIRYKPTTINELWEQVRNDEDVSTFERFVLALDLLFILGVVSLDGGRLGAVK